MSSSITYVTPARRAQKNLALCKELNRLAHFVLKFDSVYLYGSHDSYHHDTKYHDFLTVRTPINQIDVDTNLACNELAASAALLSRRCSEYSAPLKIASKNHLLDSKATIILLNSDPALSLTDLKSLNQLAHSARSYDCVYHELRLPASHFGSKPRKFLSPRTPLKASSLHDDRSSLIELNRMAKVFSIVSDFDKITKQSSASSVSFYRSFETLASGTHRTYAPGFPNPFSARLMNVLKLTDNHTFSQAFPNTYLDITKCTMTLGHPKLPSDQHKTLLASMLAKVRAFYSVSCTPPSLVTPVVRRINVATKAWFKTLAAGKLRIQTLADRKAIKQLSRKDNKPAVPRTQLAFTSSQQEPTPQEPTVEETETVDLSSAEPSSSSLTVVPLPSDNVGITIPDPDTHVIPSVFTDRSTSGADLSQLRHTLRVIRAKLTLLTTTTYSDPQRSPNGSVLPAVLLSTKASLSSEPECVCCSVPLSRKTEICSDPDWPRHQFSSPLKTELTPLFSELASAVQPFYPFFGFDLPHCQGSDFVCSLKVLTTRRPTNVTDKKIYVTYEYVNTVFTSLELAIATCSGFF
jgi:hypothetical protein